MYKNESHHKTYFEIFFLAGGWADRDFLGVGFMLMCRGVPTSVQTLTPTKSESKVCKWCVHWILSSCYIQNILPINLGPFSVETQILPSIKIIFERAVLKFPNYIFSPKNSLQKYIEGILKLQSPVLSSLQLHVLPIVLWMVTTSFHKYIHLNICSSFSIHL